MRRAWRRTRVRLIRPVSVGIAGRLAISMAAVAILAAAANLIIERGVAVVHTTRLGGEQFSPLPPVGIPEAAPATTNPETAALRAEIAQQQRLAARAAARAALLARDEFVRAVDGFELATEARVALDSPATVAHAQEGARQLGSAAVPFTGAPAFLALLSTYQAAGDAYVQAADAGRRARHDYAARIDAMDRRINDSLSRAWKIFGRVIAHQSLMQLHEDLEALQRRAATLDASSADDAATFEALEAGERMLGATLDRNESGFKRTEGAEWLRQMRSDLAQAAALRADIVSGDARLGGAADEFAEARGQLVAGIPKPRAETPPRIVARAPPVETAPMEIAPVGSAPASRPVQSTDLALPPMAAPIADVVTASSLADEHERRTTIACITVAVLSVLLGISILTVRSILVPVGRLLAATQQLASGETGVRVPRGGIKELDTLAVAFNRMAAQLAAAREVTQDYREHLETQVEQRTRQLQHLAEHDPLTLLPNRRRFFVLLNQALECAAEHGRSVAVFFIDIDNFKNLNDSLGHAFGDRVLISVAQRLEQAAASFGFAARLGGDEFTVVDPDAAGAHRAYESGCKLVEAFRQALRVDGRDVTVSVSVGASLYPEHEQHAEDLLSAADAALFRAKALGRNQLAIFTPELLETATRKFTTEQGLRRALEHGEFELVFQPEVSLESLEIGLVEALLRWRLPDGRRASPTEFLSVTEESGLIVELGNWVLRSAFATAAGWHHGAWPDVKMAINVSPRQLLDHRFVETVQALLAEFRLPPQCVEFELTESVLQTGPATIESLRLLRSLEVAIALDDFGTGYSSLASLEQLPLSRIKLDRTLIASIDTNGRSAAITAALIKLCDGLGLEVTAEGVERAAQFRCLAGNRAMYLQGYLISRPVGADEILRLKSTMPRFMHDLLLSIPAVHPDCAAHFDVGSAGAGAGAGAELNARERNL